MKIGRLNRASFAKTARRAMFLFAFAALGTQAAMVAQVGETAYETLDEAIKAVRDGETIVNAILDEIVAALARGDRVELRGFGAFSVKHRPARAGACRAVPRPALCLCPGPRRPRVGTGGAARQPG